MGCLRFHGLLKFNKKVDFNALVLWVLFPSEGGEFTKHLYAVRTKGLQITLPALSAKPSKMVSETVSPVAEYLNRW